MQTTPQRPSYSGVVAILGLVALAAGLVVMLLLPGIRFAAWIVMAIGIILLAIAFILDFRRVSGALAGRRGRFSTGATVMASIFVGIVLLVNAISIQNYRRTDVTALSQFTLTPQTKQVLQELQTPVNVLFFYGVTNQLDVVLRSYGESLLNEYQNYTKNLNVRFIDTDQEPELARQYNIDTYIRVYGLYSTAVFENQGRTRIIGPLEMAILDNQGQITSIEEEHAFTSAILEVTGKVQKKIYFLQGHGEASIAATDAGGYSILRQALRDNLFQVSNLNLEDTPQIPPDLAALVIAAPQQPLTDNEFNIIKSYLEDNGWLMVLTNPNTPENIKQLLAPWGVTIGDGTVIDPASYAAPNKYDPSVPRTRNFFGLTLVYFPGATAIIPQNKAAETFDIQPIVYTSPESWIQKNFDPEKEPVFTEGVDTKGPLALGALITIPISEQSNVPVLDTRIIVFGDSDFTNNQNFFNGNNGELFLNSVNLLTTGKQLITIERKILPFRRLLVTEEQVNFIRFSSIGLLPLLVLVIAGIVWWQRR